ncbi:DUF2000 family protein [Dactylosporangium sp. CA-052675]|uniref:DUF2000 family protein n=1 Tax=Dactylosporangium sp. CA-052675 TaxID=3239927 RepID=UPI003D8A4A2F
MTFTTKIAVLLRDDLPTWQRLNVTAFVISGIAGTGPGLLGEAYEDADGTRYLPMLGQPVMIFEGDAALLRQAHARAVSRASDQALACAIFTDELFGTGNDEDNRAAVRAVPRDALSLAGLAVHGPRNAVDKILKGARLHG